MNKTYKIQLPHNKEAQNIRTNIKDGTIEVEVELKEKWEPRDGEICYCCTKDAGWQFIIIYGDTRRPSALKAVKFGSKWEYSSHSTWKYDLIRPATDSEKQLLFDALAKEGKMWDAQKKAVVDLPRWRAEKGEPYFFVDPCWEVSCDIDDRTSPHDSLYFGGNYFKTEEAAWKTIEKICEIFKNSKAE